MTYENPNAVATYNGWTNYATWNVALWIDNEYDMYCHKMRELRSLDCHEIDADTCERIAIECLGGETTPDLTDDESGCSWSDVNWCEIADNWRDELFDR